jgi:tetratricopeptide (TPR) repeat protein
VIPPLRSQPGFFELLSEDEEKKLDAQLAAVEAEMSTEAAFLYRASIFYGYGMLDQAIEETSAALGDDLANDELRSILARLLNEAGRSAEAVDEYDRLLKPR